MFASGQATAITLDCQVSLQNPHNGPENGDSQANRYIVSGTFQCHVGTMFDAHELDQIEAEIETIGQEFKRQLTQYVTSLRPPTVVLPKLSGLPILHCTSMAHAPSPSSQDVVM